ncbi:transposase-like zinc-binding domain-containing protein [Adlercreutzia agrestimuris]|uniref:transposase-like zinc-binding domain-containing protein n=1 Tax=Adlercreutzia agrestimuris TaxID=2941324 RepID=UPI003B84914E
MKTKICPICGSKMKRNGFNSSGRQRWRCKGCNKNETHKRDNTAERFEEFLKSKLLALRGRCKNGTTRWKSPACCRTQLMGSSH